MKRLVLQVARTIGALWLQLFGKLSWEAPGWARFCGRKGAQLGNWALAHRLRAAIYGLVAAALVVGALAGVRWWEQRPKPITIDAKVTAPEPTELVANAKVNPLVIKFEGSVAPLTTLNKQVTVGIDMSPLVDGVWKWTSDSELTFTPKGDWPVGQEFTIRLAKKGLVAPHVLLSEYKLKWQTAAFAISSTKSQFYQDPVDQNLKKVVVNLTFNYAVDSASLESRIKMHLAGPEKGDSGRDYKFHVTYDKFKGNAYLHSEPIEIPRQDTEFTITIAAGAKAQRGGPGTETDTVDKIKIPGLYNFLQISGASLQIVDNERMEPEQVMVIESSIGMRQEDVQKSLVAWVLPLYDPANSEEKENKHPHAWNDPNLIGADLLKQATPLKLTAIATEKEYDTLHSFKYQGEVGRWVYLQVKKGVAGFGGYILSETFQSSARIREFPRQLKIMSQGAILSLSGERKVPVYARDIEAVQFEIGRIMPEQIQHLVSQTTGSFASPDFRNRWNFGADNISEVFSEVRELPNLGHGKPHFEAFDLTKYLSAGSERRGLFMFSVCGWDKERKRCTDERDRRLILVTDLGIIVKDAADDTHEVFVQSIRTGDPVADAKLEVYGTNGIPIFTATTNSNGQAHVPSLKEYKREKAPTLYVVKHGNDSSFIPYKRSERYLEFSRFEVGGVTTNPATAGLSAYFFSDRGVYRPGEEIRAGLIVKASNWKQDLAGVPVQLVITDARGLTVRKEELRLSASGFEEIKHQTSDISPTGTWVISAHIIKDGHAGSLLGSTTVKVREFAPDRMKISLALSTEQPEGWIVPTDLKAHVTLANLFGTPAVKRKVKLNLFLRPDKLAFPKLRDFTFFDPLRAKTDYSETLPEAVTDDKGQVSFNLNLVRFEPATYRLSVIAEGFEAEGGRSVAVERTAMISPLPYLIGYKADGSLDYLGRDAKRQIEMVAIGPTGKRVQAGDLELALFERKYVSTLVKQADDTFKYESLRKEIERGKKTLLITEKGVKLTLPTSSPGDWAWVILNKAGDKLQRVEFSVRGAGNLTRSLEKNADLQMTLSKKDYEPGEAIEMQLKAPFTGAGLITIERDKVYASRWFKAQTTASVQSIKVPADFEGTGYVSVAFVRDINSAEVFTSPLSYGVVPFSVSRARRTAQVTVETADMARPGEPFTMRYQTDRPATIVLFVVDEGIRRVANYKTPDPLGFFFQKRALEVQTAQILDLILPEFARLVNTSAPGGDDDALLNANLNPFKRRHQPPVAFWSGILDASATPRTIEYNVPDYFSGTLRVIAVAVAPEAIGTFEKRTIVRGDFVLSPNVPTFAAPGDEFEVSLAVTNSVLGSGPKAEVAVELKTSKHLEVIGSPKVKIATGELREGTALFHLRATDMLGSASLTFSAALNGKHGKMVTDLSVRPAVPYLSTFTAGRLRGGKVDVPVTRDLYPEFRTLRAGISRLPLGLAHGLAAYLEKYPHGCTEQLVSQAVPALLSDASQFGIDPAQAQKTLAQIVATLRTRQNDEGGFGLWAANPHAAPFASVYALHMLTEAKDRGFAVPPDLLKNGLAYLQSIARTEGETLADERLRSYAIYVLTRNQMVTSSFASALHKYLTKNYPDAWKSDLTAVYLAATYALLRVDKLADALIGEAKLGAPQKTDWSAYYDGLVYDSQLLYVLGKHFPARAQRVTAQAMSAIVDPLVNGSYNSLSSAYAILGLEAYGQAAQADGGKLGIAEINRNGDARTLNLPAGLLPRVDFTGGAKLLRFTSSGDFASYYLVSESGFDRGLPSKATSQKLELLREYTDASGKMIDKVGLGDEIYVHVKVRGLEEIPNIAIVDLLPGGFEVVLQERKQQDDAAEGPSRAGPRENSDDNGDQAGDNDNSADDEAASDQGPEANQAELHDYLQPVALPISVAGSTFDPYYGDIREDRVVLYGFADTNAKEFIYVIKATSAGTFVVPPIAGESMYDRTIRARGVAGKMVVVKK